ncbi:hypothetical protein VX159_09465 [Dechloromonas sp. ZY10]
MTEGLIIFALCALTLIGATLPLLYDRYRNPPAAKPENDKTTDTAKRT